MNIELLSKITRAPGAPGFEQKIRKLIIEEARKYSDAIRLDTMGNIIVEFAGIDKNKILMLAAHMDEIGFIVTHVDEEGFVRFHPLGGFDPKTLTSQRVIIHGKKDVIGVMGSKPIHVMKGEEKNKATRLEDFFIDTGYAKKDLEKLISVGNAITRERELIEMGECINAKSLDNRISVFILLEVCKALHKTKPSCNVSVTFTTQEEVGLRGAMNATRSINPDYAIAIDTTIAYDVPGTQPHEHITKLAKGVAIKIMDSSVICDYRMVQFLQKTAEKNNITFQKEILTGGGTDTMALQRCGSKGAIAGALSIPTRHIHQVIEMVHKDDVKAAIDLLNCITQSIQDFDWKHQL